MAPTNSPKVRPRLVSFISRYWSPHPIDPPTVDPALEQLNGVQRSAEVIRYSILSLEFWLSPLGRLREWVRLNTRLSVILLVPATLVLPVVTWIVCQVAGWLSALVGLAGNLILLPLVALAAALMLFIAVTFFRLIFGR